MLQRHLTLTLAIAFALVGLIVAGCGSSSSSKTTTTAALTKSEFLAKGNAICTKGQKQQKAAQAKLGKHPSKAQVLSYVKTTQVPNIQKQIDAVKALGAPAGDQVTVTKFLNLAQADLNKIKSNPTSIFTTKASPFTDFAKVAHPYGLTQCAKGA